MKVTEINYRLIINGEKCDRCSARETPVCTQVCPYGAIYPDANRNYVWADCELTRSAELCRRCVDACPNKAIGICNVPKAKVIEKKTVYFKTPGIQNTRCVIDAISTRVKEADIKAVIVASCSGSSTLLLAKVLQDSPVKIINISLPQEARERLGLQPISEKMVKRLSDLGVICREQFFSDVEQWATGRPNFGAESLFYDWQLGKEYKVEDIEKVLNATLIGIGGMGLKTAVECMFSACLYRDIQVGDSVISTAGSGWGLDTAVVMRATTPEKCFGKRPSERLEISEILAMPIKKQRWG